MPLLERFAQWLANSSAHPAVMVGLCGGPPDEPASNDSRRLACGCELMVPVYLLNERELPTARLPSRWNSAEAVTPCFVFIMLHKALKRSAEHRGAFATEAVLQAYLTLAQQLGASPGLSVEIVQLGFALADPQLPNLVRSYGLRLRRVEQPHELTLMLSNAVADSGREACGTRPHTTQAQRHLSGGGA